MFHEIHPTARNTGVAYQGSIDAGRFAEPGAPTTAVGRGRAPLPPDAPRRLAFARRPHRDEGAHFTQSFRALRALLTRTSGFPSPNPGDPMNRSTLAILFALLPQLVLGCSDTVDETPVADAPAQPRTSFVERGAHAAGYRVVQHDGLQIKVWYPTEGDSASPFVYDVTLKFPGFPAEPVPIFGTAIAGVQVADDGPWPLVVLSHGFGLNPEWYHALAEHLASHGFVVAAPEHTEADWFEDVLVATVHRPQDVSTTIDFAELPEQSSWIDTERVAVIGHSYGGYTALASAGARWNPAGLADRCADVDDPIMSAYFCESFVGQDAVLADILGPDAIPEGLWPSMADPRVDAIVSIAGDAYLFGPEGLASVSVPVMSIGGTADTGTPWDWGSQMSFDFVASDERALVGLVGAEHMIVAADCADMPFTEFMPEEYAGYFCSDPSWNKSEAHDVIHHLTTAWLGHVLGTHPDAFESLDATVYDNDDMLNIHFGE